MPLDTTPLSPLRRTLALVVICAILAASLGLAQAIISKNHHDVTLSPMLPGDAKLVESSPLQKMWRMTLGGRVREFHTYVAPTREPATLDGAKELGLDLMLDLGATQSRPGPGTIGGVPAVSLLGYNERKQPVAIASIAIVERHCIALFISSDAGDNDSITDADVAVFERICVRSQVLLDGQPYRGSRRAP